jgi:hypothetical protein
VWFRATIGPNQANGTRRREVMSLTTGKTRVVPGACSSWLSEKVTRAVHGR